MSKKILYVVAGPTASGKTALSVALAKQIGGEVVSADSMQVYKDLLIGTARPTEEEQEGVPHHLMGFLPLKTRYSVAQYAADAHKAIAAVHDCGNAPILCGGTGLYIQAVSENLTFSEEENRESLQIRARLAAEAKEHGGEGLLVRLQEIDPKTASRLHPNDHGRIVRALEVFELTGVPMSEWVLRSRANPSPYDVRVLVLSFRDRKALYERIDRRVDLMLQQGLLAEAEVVLKSPEAPTAMQAIGYKELAPYFGGYLSLAEAVENLKRGTRRYAKRQMSWFRRYPEETVLYVDDHKDIQSLLSAALKILKISE